MVGLAAPAGLCEKAETNYFSCETPSKQLIGLCGASPLRPQYRFRTPAHLEVNFPEPDSVAADNFSLARSARYQTDLVEVAFVHLGSEFTLFDYREGNNREAGVRVATPKRDELELRCSGAITGGLGALRSLLPCDMNSALTGGRCPNY